MEPQTFTTDTSRAAAYVWMLVDEMRSIRDGVEALRASLQSDPESPSSD